MAYLNLDSLYNGKKVKDWLREYGKKSKSGGLTEEDKASLKGILDNIDYKYVFKNKDDVNTDSITPETVNINAKRNKFTNIFESYPPMKEIALLSYKDRVDKTSTNTGQTFKKHARHEFQNAGSIPPDTDEYEYVGADTAPPGAKLYGSNYKTVDGEYYDIYKVPKYNVKAQDDDNRKKDEDITQAVKDTTYRLPKEYLDMYMAMSQGENKDYDFKAGRAYGNTPEAITANLLGSLIEGGSEGFISGLNKDVTAGIGKKRGMKMAKDLEEAMGAKFTGANAEQKEDYKKLKEYSDLASQKNVKSATDTQKRIADDINRRIQTDISRDIQKQNIGAMYAPKTEKIDETAEARKRFDARKVSTPTATLQPLDPEYLQQIKDVKSKYGGDGAMNKLTDIMSGNTLTGGVPVELKDRVNELQTIYEEYGKKVAADEAGRRVWLQKQLMNIQPDGWQNLFMNVLQTTGDAQKK